MNHRIAFLRRLVLECRPYNRMKAFKAGWRDYRAGSTVNPYSLNSTAAQAWDRGACVAMEHRQALRKAVR